MIFNGLNNRHRGRRVYRDNILGLTVRMLYVRTAFM